MLAIEEMLRNEKVMNYVESWKGVISKDASMRRNLELIIRAVQGDKEAEAILLVDNRPLPFAPNITYAQMNSLVILTARKSLERVPATVDIAVAGIVILVALIIGVLIMTQVKSTAMAVATANNDTDAINLINSVFNTGKAGLIILALSVLVLGAVVIIGYLRGIGGGR
ncbi:hypothetical protein ACPB8Q_04985 [Methanocaldococcus indicus]|uniref:hypothetical protein n=1 Tax=Methanocaldococcus indicus TaxID=213231 RepID=UPI003C6CE49D